jgi:hypothetical protein
MEMTGSCQPDLWQVMLLQAEYDGPPSIQSWSCISTISICWLYRKHLAGCNRCWNEAGCYMATHTWHRFFYTKVPTLMRGKIMWQCGGQMCSIYPVCVRSEWKSSGPECLLPCFRNQFLYSAFKKSLYAYKRCWKWCPRASIQAGTRLILFANTFCRSACEMFLRNAVIAVFNSLSVRGRSWYDLHTIA